MKEILSALAEHDLHPDEIIPDGKIHRFKSSNDDKKKSAWYVGFQNHCVKSGEIFHVVVFGVWGSETHTYQTGNVTYSNEDQKNIKEQISKAKKYEEEQRKKVYEETAIECQKIWETLKTEGISEYLKKKAVDGKGCRFDEKGNCVISIRGIDEKIQSIQYINWQGEKRFHTGGKVSGGCHIIGDISKGTIRIVEGFATGASIAMATSDPVCVAFSASNLDSVAKQFRIKYPERTIVLCGDEDKSGIGREKALHAATSCLGIAIFPKFKEQDLGSDFNDVHVLYGLEELKKQLNVELPDIKAVYALGFKEKEYFFTSTQNRQVVAVSAFSERDFLDLMTIDYWEALFPGKVGVNWTEAKSSLMDQCRKKGIFQSRNVRGAGVWNDNGRIVVNMGDHLIVDNQRVELGKIESRYFYTLGVKLNGLHNNPLSCNECDILVRACSTFKWLKPDFGFLLAGALVTSRICGALSVRPHTWITGGAQTGKTTLLEKLITPIIGNPVLYVQGNTSEAGVRQSLKADAIPVVFDEFEASTKTSGENIAACVELMRASWSDSYAQIIKGGAHGNATSFQVRFSAIVSSIRTNLNNDADRQRFAVIELAPHGSDQKHWAELSKLLCSIDYEYGDRLFARTIKMVPILMKNYSKLKRTLANRSNQRFGDQYGMLLAGYSILISDDAITDEESEMIADNVTLTDEKENAKIKDEDDTITRLLTKKTSMEIEMIKRDMTVAEAIKLAITDIRVKEALLRIGICVTSDSVFIANDAHAELDAQIFTGSRWSKNWTRSLARVEGAEKNKSARFAGSRVMKSTKIPLSKVFNDL